MVNTTMNLSAYLTELKTVIDSLPLQQISRAADILFECYKADHTVFTFGNGGSGALASHLVADLGKGTHFPGPKELANVRRLKAMAVTDNMPMMTAWANDTHYEDVFMRQLENFLQPGDVAFAISGSGNSPNVLKALGFARGAGATTIGLGGFGGGKMKDLLDCPVIVPSSNMQQVEDAHLVISHMIFLDLKARMMARAPTHQSA
ncbi:MAG: SIS domain-containing protein [Acidobacteria bacterium]|nr:MAG: SIS domain-containing protein [Acidobacteriota bacterium]